jgi:hypothetical protein
MKETIVVATVVAILVPIHAVAQRGGGGASFGRGIGSSGTIGRPPARPLNGSDRGVNGFGSNLGRGGFRRSGEFRGDDWNGLGGPYYDPGGYYNLPGFNEAGDQPEANPIGVMPYQGVEAAALPVQPEIHEYSWPSSGDVSVVTPNQEVQAAGATPRPGSTADPSPLFAIVSKDGTVCHARALWVQDSIVHFTTADGSGGQLPLDGIDRESTRRANAEHNLRLPLPGW